MASSEFDGVTFLKKLELPTLRLTLIQSKNYATPAF